MPNVGIMASSVLKRVAVKAAVWPNDVFTADALMPAWVSVAADVALRLPYCGYFPDPLYAAFWVTGSFMKYNGANYYWTGSQWRSGTAPTKVFLTPGANVNSYGDLSRSSDAVRVASLSNQYTPLPSTPWAAGEIASVTSILASAGSGPAHGVRWNGTAWEFVSTAPSFAGTAWSKVLTPGATALMEPTITAQDATNAAKIAGLGYTIYPAWTANGFDSKGQVFFPNPAATGVFGFFWTGSTWTVTTPVLTYVPPFAVAPHTSIAGLPANQRPWAAHSYATGGGVNNAAWPPGTYTTIGTEQMYLGAGGTPWLPGVSPGAAPPTPNKTALLPGDTYVTNQAGMPTPGVSTSPWTVQMGYCFTGAGYRPDASERMPWKSSTKKVRYTSYDVSWTGSHWYTGTLGATKTTMGPATAVMTASHQALGLVLGQVAAADRVAAMDAYYVASPLTAWGADEHNWIGGVIMQWNGTSWVVLHNPVTIHEAATIVASPGNVYVDSRVTASNSTIAGQLLGWGYVPLFRNVAGGGWKGDTSTAAATANIYFWDPGVLSGTNYAYYWNGTAWVAGTAPAATVVAPGAVVTNADISALPADERITACTAFGYTSNSNAHWTTGQSATIAGNVVHWHGATLRRYWAPGAAP